MALALLPGGGGGQTAPSEDHGAHPTPKSLPHQQELGGGTPSTPWGLGGWGPLAVVLAVAGFGGGGGLAVCPPPASLGHLHLP